MSDDSDFDEEIRKLEKELGSDSDGSSSDSDSGSGGGDDDDDMKKLLSNWESEHSKGSDDSSSGSDDSSEEERREVDLDDNTLDHIVLAAPNFEKALDEFEEKTSILPRISGSIKGLGIKTARISFEGASFVEIIAPDPDDNGPIGNLLLTAGLPGLVPFHYAIRNEKCEDLKKEVAKLGYTPDHISMFGAKEDGTPRKWEMLYLYGHKLGGIAPFIINWANSDHPCETLPVVGTLKYLRIKAPVSDPVHKLFNDVVNPKFVELEEGPKHFEFSFTSPEGVITFESTKMVGFRFPGFEEECGPVEGSDDEAAAPAPGDDDSGVDSDEMFDINQLDDASDDDLASALAAKKDESDDDSEPKKSKKKKSAPEPEPESEDEEPKKKKKEEKKEKKEKKDKKKKDKKKK